MNGSLGIFALLQDGRGLTTQGLTFFAVLIRVGVLFSLLPFFSERNLPVLARVLLGLSVTVCLYPTLVQLGWIQPEASEVWGSTVWGLVSTVTKEVFLGLVLGFLSKLFFEAIQAAGEVMGTLMGFATASQFDPQTESQTQVLTRLQLALATLLFIAMDGHHLLLTAVMESFRYVGIGGVRFEGTTVESMIRLSGELLKTSLELSAPMILAMSLVFCTYAVFARALPQVNLLVLSMSMSASIGLVVMLLGAPHFQSAVSDLLGRMGHELGDFLRRLG